MSSQSVDSVQGEKQSAPQSSFDASQPAGLAQFERLTGDSNRIQRLATRAAKPQRPATDPTKVQRPAANQTNELRQERWRRAGDTLGIIGLVLVAICLGIVLLEVGLSTIWLMVGANDGNLTQSMSIYTWFSSSSFAVLGAGVLGAVALLALCYLAARYARFFDGKFGLRVLLVATFLFQALIILCMQTRDTYWGDSWMIRDFVQKALDSGVASLFSGAYSTLFYDARLYFSCYPFQASVFWVLYALRIVFGEYAYMVFQLLSAAVVEIGVLSLVVLGEKLGLSVQGRRVLMVLIAACLPMYWLSLFIYGNAMGCGFALAFLALQACSLQEKRRLRSVLYAAFSLIPLTLALCIKATFILFAIGAVLAQIVVAVHNRSGLGLAACVVVVALAHTLSGLPFQALKAASGGYEFMGSLTTLNHLELGLRMGYGEFYISIDGGEVSYAPGGWSNYANAVWEASNGDARLQNEYACESLIRDLSDFAVDPSYVGWFFSTKLATEWADPTYQSLYYLSMCGLPDGSRVNPADTNSALGIVCTVLIFFLDGYQSVVFAAAFGIVIWACWHWRRGAFNTSLLLLGATFFTGFGCYLLWEAKAVYVLPYAIVIIPLAALALDKLLSRFAKL